MLLPKSWNRIMHEAFDGDPLACSRVKWGFTVGHKTNFYAIIWGIILFPFGGPSLYLGQKVDAAINVIAIIGCVATVHFSGNSLYFLILALPITDFFLIPFHVKQYNSDLFQSLMKKAQVYLMARRLKDKASPNTDANEFGETAMGEEGPEHPGQPWERD